MRNVTIGKIISLLEKEAAQYQVPVVELMQIQTRDPYKVLVTTILSARTKDETTAKRAPELFKRAPNLEALSRLTEKEIQKLIFPVGFYKNKARFLKNLPRVLAEEFGSVIPQTVEELVRLPGVGRKTANLVSAVAFEKPAICVDIHVHRIMNRLGYVKTQTPFQTEMTLRDKLPEKYWLRINSLLVAFGQNLCRPVSPHCSNCPLRPHCPRVGVTTFR